MRWEPGVADRVKRVSQGILAVRLEGNVKVDGCASCRVTNALPVGRDGIQPVLHQHIVPKRCERCHEVSYGRNGEEKEHREPVIAHG